MNVDTFMQRFRLVARAPNGVSRLRELVLQLAVTGRLFVDPHPSDADELIDAINKDRERRIEEGKIKRRRPMPAIEPASLDIKVPTHWRWLRLADLTSKIGSGSTPRGGAKVYVSTGVAFLRSQNVWNDGVRLDDVVYIPESIHERMQNTHVKADDILLNITGASLGRCAKVPDGFPEANVSQHVTIIRLVLRDLRHFIHLWLLSPMGQKMIWGRQVGMAREGLSKKVLEQFEIPIPPLTEQKRIVARVDELMALCDRLESQLNERAKLLPLLSRANHDRFLQGPTEGHLASIFRESLVSSKESQKSILTLAMSGRLTQQTDDDEPVAELLKRIMVERTTAGHRSGSVGQHVSREMLGYDIPASWECVRLEALLISGPTNGFSPKAVEYETPIRSLTLTATTSGKFDGTQTKFIDSETPIKDEWWLRDGDILVQRGNTIEYVGVPAVYHGSERQFIFPDLMMRIRPSRHLNVDFIHLAMSEESSRQFLRERATGTAGTMPKINQKTLKSLPIPVPPVAEQDRIVEQCVRLADLVVQLESLYVEERRLAERFAKAAISTIVTTDRAESVMNTPDRVIVSRITTTRGTSSVAGSLSQILTASTNDLSARELWQRSGLEIGQFYRQLRTEIANGWIAEPEPATVEELEVN